MEVENERERTLKVKQQELKSILPIQSAQNIFDLNLPDFGPYTGLSVTRNGRYIVMGGKKGHIAALDWRNKDILCEFQAKDRVNDVQFLHNHQMFAAA